MRDSRKSVKGWLGRAAAAVSLLLVAACASAYNQVSPLDPKGKVTSGGEQIDLDQMVCPPTLSPCANAVRPSNDYGYIVQQVNPTTYKIFFEPKLKPTYALNVPQRNYEAQSYLTVAFDLATYRAAQLAQENGAPAFSISDRTNFLHVVVKNNQYGDVSYRECVARCQTLDCGCVPTYFDYATQGLPSGLGTYGHYDLIDARVLLTIQFEKDVKPGAYVTQEALAALQKEYPSLTTASSGQTVPAADTTAPQTPAAAPADTQAPAAAPDSAPAAAPPPKE
ncbi:MAG: hypothetical protein ACHQF3_08085 [Alphaproteobacteria bacterium]